MLILIPLWVYLAGVVLVLLFGAKRIGEKSQVHRTDFDEALERVKKALKAKRSSFDYDYHGKALGLFNLKEEGWVLADTLFEFGRTTLAAIIWPIALPLWLMFDKGKKKGKVNRSAAEMLQDAEAEIKRIKEQEGWT